MPKQKGARSVVVFVVVFFAQFIVLLSYFTFTGQITPANGSIIAGVFMLTDIFAFVAGGFIDTIAEFFSR